MDRLDPDAISKVSGPAWRPLRAAFMQISETLLSVAPDVRGSLTTIYVKYCVQKAGGETTYAVVWIRKSSEIVVGLALPDGFSHPRLYPPPTNRKYANTAFFTVTESQGIPVELPEWANIAYRHIAG
jgi:hypothetical protein